VSIGGPVGAYNHADDYANSAGMYIVSGKNVLKKLSTTNGSSLTSNAGVINNAGSNRKVLAGIWATPPLAAQTLTGSQAISVAVASSESAGNMEKLISYFLVNSNY
jgi:hypothetical protein